jgi:imidazolonepropionase-like amidohydrolase
MITAIKNIQIFDGDNIIAEKLILIEGERILSVGGEIPAGATIIDAHNVTLMPRLIDSHVHTDIDGLHDTLLFGVILSLQL